MPDSLTFVESFSSRKAVLLSSSLMKHSVSIVVSVAFLGDCLISHAWADQKTNSVRRITAPTTSNFRLCSAANFDPGYLASEIAAGDFKGDGKLDLAVLDCPNFGCPATISCVFGERQSPLL